MSKNHAGKIPAENDIFSTILNCVVLWPKSNEIAWAARMLNGKRPKVSIQKKGRIFLKLKTDNNNSFLISLSGSISIIAIANGPQSPIIPSMLPKKKTFGFSHHWLWLNQAVMNQHSQGKKTAAP